MLAAEIENEHKTMTQNIIRKKIFRLTAIKKVFFMLLKNLFSMHASKNLKKRQNLFFKTKIIAGNMSQLLIHFHIFMNYNLLFMLNFS